MPGHDTGNTHQAAEAAAPERPLTERWRQTLPHRDTDYNGHGPVVAANRVLLFWLTSTDGLYVPTLLTYDLFTGTPGWKVERPDWPNTLHPLLTDERVLLHGGEELEGIYELDPADGTVRWNTALPGDGDDTTGILPYGKRIYGARHYHSNDDPADANIVALGGNGNVCSETTATAEGGVSAGAVGHGQLYFGGSYLRAYDPNTDEFTWRIQRGPPQTETVVAGPDRVYVAWGRLGDRAGRIGAYDPAEGEEVWERSEGENYWPRTMGLADGVLLVGERPTRDAYQLVARNAETGDQKWSIETPRDPSPAIADGVVYVAQADSEDGHYLGLYDLESGDRIARYPLPVVASSPVVASGHVLLIIREERFGDHQLVAFR